MSAPVSMRKGGRGGKGRFTQINRKQFRTGKMEGN